MSEPTGFAGEQSICIECGMGYWPQENHDHRTYAEGYAAALAAVRRDLPAALHEAFCDFYSNHEIGKHHYSCCIDTLRLPALDLAAAEGGKP